MLPSDRATESLIYKQLMTTRARMEEGRLEVGTVIASAISQNQYTIHKEKSYVWKICSEALLISVKNFVGSPSVQTPPRMFPSL